MSSLSGECFCLVRTFWAVARLLLSVIAVAASGGCQRLYGSVLYGSHYNFPSDETLNRFVLRNRRGAKTPTAKNGESNDVPGSIHAFSSLFSLQSIYWKWGAHNQKGGFRILFCLHLYANASLGEINFPFVGN